MDSAGSARHSLAVATTVVAVALCCAAAVGGRTGPSPGNTAAAAPSSLLTKLPQPQLPKLSVIYTYGKHQSSTTNPPTYPVNKQQPSQRPSPQQQPQQPSKPQKRPPKPTTVDERPGGRDQPYQSSSTNASVMTTSQRPKVETTTQDRAIITVPLKACPDGQRMGPDRNCRPDFPDPEGDQSK